MAKSRPVPMDSLICSYVPKHIPIKEPDLFGIEVELEGEKIIVTDNPDIDWFWKQVKDGSLRVDPKNPKSECIEYVFRGPLNTKQTADAVKLLTDYLTSKGVKVFDSYRTSIHVHVNCMEETIRTVVNFITLSMIFDELFVSQNGQTRIGNNFCLRTRDAEGQVDDLAKQINSNGTPFTNGHNRYSAFNTASLAKFGTIEYRSLECTTDYDRIMHWVGTLQALKVAARTYKDPKDIIAEYSRKGPVGFVSKNLGDYAKKYLAVGGASNMLHNGMRLAQDFAFCSEWRVPEAKIDPKRKAVVKKPGEKFAFMNAQYGAEHINEMYNNMGHAPQPQPVAPPPVGAPDWNAYWNEHPAPAMNNAGLAAYVAQLNAQAAPQPMYVADDIGDDDQDPDYPMEGDDDDF